VLYAESADKPKMFAFQQHPLIMGRAHRSLYYDRLLDYIKGHEGVWFARCNDVAQWWLKHYNTKAGGPQFNIKAGRPC